MKFKLKHGTCCNTSSDYEDELAEGDNINDVIKQYVETAIPDGGSCQIEIEDQNGMEEKVVKKFIKNRDSINVRKYDLIWNLTQKDKINLISYDDIRFPKKLKDLESKHTVML